MQMIERLVNLSHQMSLLGYAKLTEVAKSGVFPIAYLPQTKFEGNTEALH